MAVRKALVLGSDGQPQQQQAADTVQDAPGTFAFEKLSGTRNASNNVFTSAHTPRGNVGIVFTSEPVNPADVTISGTTVTLGANMSVPDSTDNWPYMAYFW